MRLLFLFALIGILAYSLSGLFGVYLVCYPETFDDVKFMLPYVVGLRTLVMYACAGAFLWWLGVLIYSSLSEEGKPTAWFRSYWCWQAVVALLPLLLLASGSWFLGGIAATTLLLINLYVWRESRRPIDPTADPR